MDAIKSIGNRATCLSNLEQLDEKKSLYCQIGLSLWPCPIWKSSEFFSLILFPTWTEFSPIFHILIILAKLQAISRVVRSEDIFNM